MGTLPGDRATRFSLLYERCYGAVYAYAARRVGAGVASEIAAETFLIAWRRLDVVPEEPLPWLYRVARNVVLRYHVTVARQDSDCGRRLRMSRWRRRTVRPTAAMCACGRRGSNCVNGDREVLALIAWEELSVAQAARVLGCAAPVFSVRLHRARRRLARLLASPPNASALEPSEAR